MEQDQTLMSSHQRSQMQDNRTNPLFKLEIEIIREFNSKTIKEIKSKKIPGTKALQKLALQTQVGQSKER